MLACSSAFAQQPQPTDAEKLAMCQVFAREVRSQREAAADSIAGALADLSIARQQIEQLKQALAARDAPQPKQSESPPKGKP